MKKQLLTLLFLGISFTTLSQQKKKPITKLTEIQQVKSSAMSWFKNVYVESNFKDPYSYKVLKSTIIPISFKEGLESMIDQAERSAKRTDTADWGSDYKIQRRKYFQSERYHKNRFTDADTLKQAYINSNKILKWELSKVNDEIKKHFAFKSERDSLIKLKGSISEKKAIETFYYIVYIDCYSNNSYGNAVLGKYSFHYNKNGLVRDPIKLNND
jgi:hypothetical protein